jgi:hypothetical protein
MLSWSCKIYDLIIKYQHIYSPGSRWWAHEDRVTIGMAQNDIWTLGYHSGYHLVLGTRGQKY